MPVTRKRAGGANASTFAGFSAKLPLSRVIERNTQQHGTTHVGTQAKEGEERKTTTTTKRAESRGETSQDDPSNRGQRSDSGRGERGKVTRRLSSGRLSRHTLARTHTERHTHRGETALAKLFANDGRSKVWLIEEKGERDKERERERERRVNVVEQVLKNRDRKSELK